MKKSEAVAILAKELKPYAGFDFDEVSAAKDILAVVEKLGMIPPDYVKVTYPRRMVKRESHLNKWEPEE